MMQRRQCRPLRRATPALDRWQRAWNPEPHKNQRRPSVQSRKGKNKEGNGGLHCNQCHLNRRPPLAPRDAPSREDGLPPCSPPSTSPAEGAGPSAPLLPSLCRPSMLRTCARKPSVTRRRRAAGLGATARREGRAPTPPACLSTGASPPAPAASRRPAQQPPSSAPPPGWAPAAGAPSAPRSSSR